MQCLFKISILEKIHVLIIWWANLHKSWWFLNSTQKLSFAFLLFSNPPLWFHTWIIKESEVFLTEKYWCLISKTFMSFIYFLNENLLRKKQNFLLSPFSNYMTLRVELNFTGVDRLWMIYIYKQSVLPLFCNFSLHILILILMHNNTWK